MTFIQSIDQMKFLPIAFVLSLVLVTATSCDKEDEEPEACASVTTIGGDMQVNGETLSLTVAQNIVNSGGGVFGDTYLFQLTGVSADCNSFESTNFTVSVPSGSSVSGTYTITDFFSAGDNDAYGSYITQSVNPISQSSVDMASGSVTLVDNGSNSFDIDLDATLVGGDTVTMSISHQF